MAPTVTELLYLVGERTSGRFSGNLAYLNWSQKVVDRAATVLDIVTNLVRAYTRGVGFESGEANTELAAVILTASARLFTNGGQIRYALTKGPQAASFGDGFSGWTLAELAVLNRYRVRAR